jgi:L-cysteine S-thiosulfotransferase
VHTKSLIAAAILAGLTAAVSRASEPGADHTSPSAPMAVPAALVDQAMEKSFTRTAPDWKTRLTQDETQALCSRYRNAPPAAVGAAIVARERAMIRYPADGKLMGDWRHGESLAQSGYGGRYTDYPPRAENGGNCYACHQLDKKELSFGTLGPSLRDYGKIHDFAAAEVKAVYQRIYNAHSLVACANMPRLGSSGILTVEQIRDLVAYVMSPDSPVNR